MNIDKMAHELFKFRPQKWDGEFDGGGFLVAYHENRLYSVRDTKLKTVKLVEASSPFEAANAAKSSSYDLAAPKNGLWVNDSEYLAYLRNNSPVEPGEMPWAALNEIAFNLRVLAGLYAERSGYAPEKWNREAQDGN